MSEQIVQTKTGRPSPRRDKQEWRDARFAMRLSLIFGLVMLGGKTTAYLMTHSAAILSDAAESVIHVVAVAFAAFSLRLSTKPAAPQFLCGYERITFFSAGFEGAMIILAAIVILAAAIQKWLAGLRLENLGTGTLLVLAAGILNAGLGYYLLRVGHRTKSLILEANGKHVLTDSWTSFGVVGGLGLVLLTRWKPLDPLVAIAVAVNILWSGGHLVWRSAVGLLDYSDPSAGRQIREKLDAVCCELGVHYHGVRFRTTGYRQIIEVHLLFPHLTPVGEAHRLATILEDTLPLGYDLKDRKLVVDREEARVVRNLFKSVSCSGMRPKAEDTSRSRRNQEQGENQRSGEPFRGNFVFPRSALSDPEKPHLPRRDSPPGPESSRPTQGDCPARTLGPSAGKVE